MFYKIYSSKKYITYTSNQFCFDFGISCLEMFLINKLQILFEISFYTLRKKINNLEEIENINSLGFLRNGPETSIISKVPTKVQKVDSVNVSDLMTKLFKKEIDAVVGGSYLKYVWKKNNLKEDNLNCRKTITKHELYIAASIKSSEKFLEDFKKIIQNFKKTKKYKDILKKYQYLWEESS